MENRMSRRDRRRQARRPASPSPRPAAGASPADVRRAFMGAVQHFQAGRNAQAEMLCRQVLMAMPNNPDALLLSGMIAGRSGRYDEAVSVLEKCVAHAPQNAAAHLNLGRALAAQGRTDRALAAYDQALRIEPRLAEAHYSLGNLKREAEDMDEAAAAYRRAVDLQPAFAAAWDNLGNVLQELERFDEALEAYEKVLALDPASASAHNNLGTLLRRRGWRDQAIEEFETALRLDPGFTDAWVNLGRARSENSQSDEAETAFLRALNLDADSPDAIGELARLYEQTNQIGKAEETANRGLAIDPGHGVCNVVLAQCERRSGRIQEGIDRLETLVSGLDLERNYHLMFELGALYDRAGNADAAFANFREANRLSELNGGGFVEEKRRYLSKVERATARFTDDWVRSWTADLEPDARPSPAFLVGFPRSGTTLLEQIIDAHPRLAAIDERRTVDVVAERVGAMDGGYPDALADLTARDIADLRNAYFDAAERFVTRPPQGLIVDKMPLNITDAGLIHRLFPDARFILAIRHPCDASLSTFMQHFNPNDAMVNTLSMEDTAALYAKVMALWRQYIGVLPLRYHQIRYEDLIADVEGQIAPLLDFLDVGWDNAVLAHTDYARTRGRIFTPSYHQVSEPIYTWSRYRWRKYRDHLAPVMSLLQPWIDYYGYETD